MDHGQGVPNLQLLVSSREEDRVLFGLNLALAAAASEIGVVVFFALGSARWVCAKHGKDGLIATAVQDLLRQGVEVYCCSSCSHKHCSPSTGESVLAKGVRPGGLTSVVQRAATTFRTITV